MSSYLLQLYAWQYRMIAVITLYCLYLINSWMVICEASKNPNIPAGEFKSKVDGLESLNPKRLICLFFYDDFRPLHPLQFPRLAPRWMGAWQRFQVDGFFFDVVKQRVATAGGWSTYPTTCHITLASLVALKLRNELGVFLPETRDALASCWTKNCRSFFSGDLDVVDTSSSVFTARSQLTLNGVPQVLFVRGAFLLPLRQGSGRMKLPCDPPWMWMWNKNPTSLAMAILMCNTCLAEVSLYWYICLYNIYIDWCTKWNSILHGMTRQNNSLPPKCCFPGDIAACFACISRICSDKMGCGSVGTRNSQIWHHVLNVVSFFKCSDIYFDQVTNFEKKTETGLLFFVRIWLLYSWKDVPERVENCKQNIIFLYRWTPTMICISRLVIGWFILRVGCEICPAVHWTFFWGI